VSECRIEAANGDTHWLRNCSRPLHAAVLHADIADEAEALLQTIAEQFQCVELYVTALTPVMGIHTGPGVLGTAFYTDKGV
jgi:fatty acid-binding protein DegV